MITSFRARFLAHWLIYVQNKSSNSNFSNNDGSNFWARDLLVWKTHTTQLASIIGSTHVVTKWVIYHYSYWIFSILVLSLFLSFFYFFFSCPLMVELRKLFLSGGVPPSTTTLVGTPAITAITQTWTKSCSTIPRSKIVFDPILKQNIENLVLLFFLLKSLGNVGTT